MIDPQARALIELMEKRQVPPVHTLAPVDARFMYRDRRTFTQPDEPPVASCQNLRTDTGVGLRLYKPFNVVQPPVLLYLHGGGWVIGDLDTHDVLCRQLCSAAGVAVLAVDYRLAPEHKFPAAVDDSLAAALWLHREGPALGLDTQRWAVGGDSAGGNLAAVVALMLRDLGAAQPESSQVPPARLQLLIYPATDMRAVAPSHTSNGRGYLLTNDSMRYYRGHYTPDAAQWADWRASPLLASNLGDLPPALVLTAGFDPLRDEGLQYADALSAAGNRVQHLCFERQVHGFITMGRVIDEANLAVDVCAAALRKALHG